jgi:hypothetical protein
MITFRGRDARGNPHAGIVHGMPDYFTALHYMLGWRELEVRDGERPIAGIGRDEITGARRAWWPGKEHHYPKGES